MPLGGSLKASVIKDMIKASYNNNEGYDTIDGFTKNKQLSNSEVLCYYNSSTGQAVAVFRGTEGTATDWSNNAKYAVGLYDTTDRLARAKEAYNKIINTYGEKNVSLVGHSQSAVITRKLGANAKEVINHNGANLGEKSLDNEYNIRSSSDAVSQVKPIADVYNKVQDTKWNAVKSAANWVLPKKQQFEMAKDTSKQNITIPASSLNVVSEHSPDILDALGDQMIGSGFNKGSVVQSILFDREKWTLKRAENWLKKNKYKYSVDKTSAHFRFRQLDPEKLEHKGYHFVTTKIGAGIKAIIGILGHNKVLPDFEGHKKPSMKRLEELELEYKLSRLKKYDEDKDKDIMDRLRKMEEAHTKREVREPPRRHQPVPDRMARAQAEIDDIDTDGEDDIAGGGIRREEEIIKKLKKIGDQIHEHQHIHGGKIHIAKSFKDLGSKIKKGFVSGIGADEAIKDIKYVGDKAGHYITDKNGLEKDVINYGIPSVTGAIGGVAGEMVGGPLGGMAGSAMGAKAGDLLAQQVDKQAGVGRRGTGFEHVGNYVPLHSGIINTGARRPRGRPRKQLPHSNSGTGIYDHLTLGDLQKMDSLQKEHKLRSGIKEKEKQHQLKLELERVKRDLATMESEHKPKAKRRGIKGRAIMKPAVMPDGGDLVHIDIASHNERTKGRGRPKLIQMNDSSIESPQARLMAQVKAPKSRGMGFKKGSQEAKDHMARIRAMRKK